MLTNLLFFNPLGVDLILICNIPKLQHLVRFLFRKIRRLYRSNYSERLRYILRIRSNSLFPVKKNLNESMKVGENRRMFTSNLKAYCTCPFWWISFLNTFFNCRLNYFCCAKMSSRASN
jgi:hypothetical protein